MQGHDRSFPGCLERLDDNALPPKEAFFSRMKNEGISDEDYETKPYLGKDKSYEAKPFIESDDWKVFLSVINCIDKKCLVRNSEDKANMISFQNRHQRGRHDTIIMKKIWLAMKYQPRLELTAVCLKIVGCLLKACGQYLVITKHKNMVYRFNIIRH